MPLSSPGLPALRHVAHDADARRRRRARRARTRIVPPTTITRAVISNSRPAKKSPRRRRVAAAHERPRAQARRATPAVFCRRVLLRKKRDGGVASPAEPAEKPGAATPPVAERRTGDTRRAGDSRQLHQARLPRDLHGSARSTKWLASQEGDARPPRPRRRRAHAGKNSAPSTNSNLRGWRRSSSAASSRSSASRIATRSRIPPAPPRASPIFSACRSTAPRMAAADRSEIAPAEEKLRA